MTERPLKIGMVCYPTFGGSGAVAAELGRHLARRGHTVHFISQSRPFRIAQDFHENIYYHKIAAMEYALFEGSLYDIAAAVRIYETIQEEGLDLIHVHYALPHAICAFLAAEMLPPGKRIPVLTTLHGTDITFVGSSPSFKPAVKLGLDKSDGLTAVSQWLADETCKSFAICERLNVIHNFVDPLVFRPGPRECNRGRFAKADEAILLHVSNFRPVKRTLDVIKTFAAVLAARPAKLLLIGDGPDREAAWQLASRLGVSAQVHFLGEQYDVNVFYSMADLLLFPSDGESFGLAAAEAMASEIPVVGARAGGLPEVVVDGETGFLLPVGDTFGMAEACLTLLADSAARKAMGAAGRKRIIENFAPELIVPKYEAYYESLLRRA